MIISWLSGSWFVKGAIADLIYMNKQVARQEDDDADDLADILRLLFIQVAQSDSFTDSHQVYEV